MLWFGLMSPGGTGNIFIEMAVRRNRRIDFVEPCPLAIRVSNNHSWPYTSRRVPYVEAVEEQYNTGWRSMPWHIHKELIKDIQQQYHPKLIWAATFDEQVMSSVQLQWQQQCFSVSINYSVDDFEFMKKKWARWQTGLVMESTKHTTFKQRFRSDPVAIEQYLLENGSKDFGYELPQSRSAKADIEIALRDLFNKEKFAIILDRLEVKNTDDDWKFYDSYCAVSG
jgi:hypothetical protein